MIKLRILKANGIAAVVVAAGMMAVQAVIHMILIPEENLDQGVGKAFQKKSNPSIRFTQPQTRKNINKDEKNICILAELYTLK